MAGRFIVTKPTIQNEMPTLLVDQAKSLLNNPYYLFNNNSATTVTYYNLNTTQTTLDEATRGNYGEISPESPLRFNKINGFRVYGFNRIEPTVEVNDFGLEGSEVSGDCIILPRTIIPYPGDYFVVDQLGDNYLFKVTAANINTLDTGATLYRINYKLSNSDGLVDIEKQVVKEYNFSVENYGSNFGCLIESASAAELGDVEKIIEDLQEFYISVFYDAKIQSFSYLRNGQIKVYDPFLLEFIIRNKLLSGADKYLYLSHQVFLPTTFPIDYEKTFFAALEDKDPTKHYCRCEGNLELCTQKLSLLYAYPQDYYVMRYDPVSVNFHLINIFEDPSFMDKIRNNETVDDPLKAVIIAYFNDTEITMDMLNKFKHIDFMENCELFYEIPVVIYCLTQHLNNKAAATSV